MNRFVELYRKLRKKQMLSRSFSGSYAFVGVGNHSLNNLYPILHFLNITLKYVVTRSEQSAKLVQDNWTNVIGTSDLNLVLDDPEVKGVLICSDPKSHFALVSECLLRNKHVFVEKPPCYSLDELFKLIEISKKTQTSCLVGVQKRYAPSAKILKSKLKQDAVLSYSYKYVTGAYPEGDVIMDLFIHPLDFIQFLFGEAKVLSVVKSTSTEGGITLLIHLKHNEIVGSLELSTQYSWANATEKLSINTRKGAFELDNQETLVFQQKQGTIMGIPLEKVFPNPLSTVYLAHRNNFVPVQSNNQLVTMGYYDELKAFAQLCESKKQHNLSSLEDLVQTYKLINELKNQYV